MKQIGRWTALFLSVAILCGAFASCETELVETTEETGGTLPTLTLETKTEVLTEEKRKPEVTPFASAKSFLPENGELTLKTLETLPVANDQMSYAQLRQLCLDYFELQCSIPWVPNMDVLDYSATYATTDKTILTKNLYGGIPYQSKGTGNLYRWMEYYDHSTGVLDIKKALEENGGYGDGAQVIDVKKDSAGNITHKKYRSMMVMFNQCSVASFWGWGRVINSANFGWTYDMNVYNGFIPVGGYTYKNYETLDGFGLKSDVNPTGYDNKHVIADWIRSNGAEAMYECYAYLRPADCVVSGGHAMMVRSVNVVRDSAGKIDPDKSYAVVIEQIERWGKKGTVDGKEYYRAGGINHRFTFKNLQSKEYIPFTFAEFLDPNDPQDKWHLDFYHSLTDPLASVKKDYSAFTFTEEEIKLLTGLGVEKAVSFSTHKEKSVTPAQFEAMSVASNYAISDAFIRVLDPSGNVLLENISRATSARLREISMKTGKATWEFGQDGERLTVSDGIESFANGQNRVEVLLRVSTGELLCAYSGVLISE